MKRKPGRPLQRRVESVIVHDSARSRAEQLGAILKIHPHQALGLMTWAWFGYLHSVRPEDEIDGVIREPFAKEKFAGMAGHSDPALLYAASVSSGFIEDYLSRGTTQGQVGDPPVGGLRFRGMSAYKALDERREYERERKQKQREDAKEARQRRRKQRGLIVPRDNSGTTSGHPSDVPDLSHGRHTGPRPPDGRTDGSSESTFSNPSVRPSPSAPSLISRVTPPVPLSSASATPAPKKSVDVGKLRREKRLAAKASKSAYAVTFEADAIADELDALFEAEWAPKGIPAPRTWTDRPEALEALRALRYRFSAKAVQNAFAAFLGDSSFRDRRLIVFLLTKRVHAHKCEKAEAELAATPTPMSCLACGGPVPQARQLWGLEYVDACAGCMDRFLESVGTELACTREAVPAWEAWLAGEKA